MRRNRLLAAAATLLLLAGPALAQKAEPQKVPAPAYKVPRNALGQPQLDGTWSNATLTPTARSPLYGPRGVHTAEEVRQLEGGAADKAEAGNAKSDLSKSLNDSANVGAYNQGWIDGGSHVMRVRGEPRTSLITTADGQPPPAKGMGPRTFQPGAGSAEAGQRAVKAALSVDQLAAQGAVGAVSAMMRSGAFDNPEARGYGERCMLSFGRNGGPPMFPNGWYNNNYQIVQARDAVVIDIEMVHDARVVRLNSKHRTDGIRPWFGDAIGWYDGDSLVVETTNIPQTQQWYGAWRELKVTERFTPVAKDRLLYQFSVEDPTVWDKPWGGEYEFSRLNGTIMEYACHEGNYALEGVLAGARETERQAAEAAKPVAAASNGTGTPP